MSVCEYSNEELDRRDRRVERAEAQIIQFTLTGTPATKEEPAVGRPRREDHRLFTIGDLNNAIRIVNYGAPVPPPCLCGEREYYLYTDERSRLIAECRTCHFKRIFSSAAHMWGPFEPKR